MTNSKIARHMEGKKIVRVELNASQQEDTGQGMVWVCDPTLVLSDGSRIHFHTVELDDGYGLGMSLEEA